MASGFPPLPTDEPPVCPLCGGTGRLPRIKLGERSIVIAGTRVYLSPQYRAIVGVLARTPGRAIHHERLFAVMWPRGDPPFDSIGVLRVCIAKLRKKFKGLAKIETVWGFGYRLMLA